MNDTTNNEQRIEDEEATTSNLANAAGAEASNRTGNAGSINSNNNPAQATVSSTSTSAQQSSNNLEDEEEHIVTSTSSENSGNTPRRQAASALHSLITSPARITSSTGNDYSSSPTQAAQTREEPAHISLSSEDDSLEQQQVVAAPPAAPVKLERNHDLNAGMPTTSAAAAARLRTIADPKRSERTKDTAPDKLCNHAPTETGRETKSSHSVPSINSSSSNSSRSLNSNTTDKMVARESVSNLGGSCSTGAAVQSEHQVEKIILKLPKPTPNPALSLESHQHQQQDKLVELDPAMSNSCSNSSTNSSVTAEPDTRKVEPLKINLHHGSHHHHHHSPSGGVGTSNVIPKITIKPLIKKPESVEEAHEKSASANQEAPIPKFTIKASSLSATSAGNSEGAASTEPHIVPKLTIRAAHEDGGGTLTSVVPKLTIKLPDQQSAHSLHNSLHSPASTSRTNLLETPQQPPLPKLTIKTTLDGASGSSIMCSSISPALSSSNSSSSAASSPQNAASTTSNSSSSASSAVGAVPKLSIKTSSTKGHEDHPALPKLTIKTSATGSCVSTTPATTEATVSSVAGTISATTSAPSNKLPKLTIKTGQEHAVIITQHNNDQPIPKLTIKTKSLELEESLSEDAAGPPEKIPKFTIKAAIEPNSSIIPKLTISTPNSPKSLHHNTSSLVVRQVAVAAGQPATTRNAQSPDRVPKLMISRQDTTTVNNCNATADPNAEKTVPKLTIKATPNDYRHEESCNEKIEKIAKFTIRNVQPNVNATQQSSEESDDALSVESAPSPAHAAEQHSNKLVPKLTIKNLGSPKLKLKSVMEEIPAAPSEKFHSSTASRTADVPVSASPQSTRKKTAQANETAKAKAKAEEAEAIVNADATAVALMANGGESSSSQEFCGFTDNTTTSAPTPTLLHDNSSKTDAAAAPLAMQDADEPRRNSDDMDIDEDVQQHDPKVFNNLTHFGSITRNGESYGIHLDNNIDALPTVAAMSANSKAQLAKQAEPADADIVDTVDLTSSPSPSSSPAHFNYTDADPKIPELSQLASHPGLSTSNALLMECLQRETSVIQTAHSGPVVGPKANSNSLLLSQLTAPLRHPPPPPLLPRPPPHLSGASHSSLRYPQLTERLLANGAHLPTQQPPPRNMSNQMFAAGTNPPATVIDSIEILDTPEGSPRSSLDDAQPQGDLDSMLASVNQKVYASQMGDGSLSAGVLHHNNNVVHNTSTAAAAANFNNHHSNSGLKRQSKDSSIMSATNESLGILPQKVRRTESPHVPTMATLTIFTNDNNTNSARVITTSPTLISSVGEIHCNTSPVAAAAAAASPNVQQPPQHRSRKQKHEHLLSLPMDELESVNATFTATDATKAPHAKEPVAAVAAGVPAITPTPKKRGRPKKIQPQQPQAQAEVPTSKTALEERPNTPTNSTSSAAERRVQLLRKRLAIDMVASEQPTAVLEDMLENSDAVTPLEEVSHTETPRRERAVRSTRRCATPNATSEKLTTLATKQQQRKQRSTCETLSTLSATTATTFNHFGGSNSSISSACSSSSSYATTMTTTAATTNICSQNVQIAATSNLSNCSFSMSAQIDLSSSSSMTSINNGNATATVTMGEAVAQRRVASMLPPTKALSSSDPLPDVVFRSQDFSAIMLTQQLQTSPSTSRLSSRENSQDGTEFDGSIGSGSGDDSASNISPTRTSGSGRGRGRGRGRGSRGGAHKAHRLGRGASAVAKQIAMNRPRHVGVLKHTPQPERLKGLFSPSPQVFEEDTRMSADLSQMQFTSEPHTPMRQPDFFTNEEESQSSILSNASASILDPNTVAAVQGGASVKRIKKKKMEVCASDETEYLVSSIAEYDWPPPKGCCPSKNRDTFMIQEQVANYLGIKSFKRKYPDLPRRQIDMEERNWLQEKGLVTEKMCDLGITAVWASDILDIMYADFYDKYEEYKDYMRQKHLREIEAKQKALGLNVTGRGLQARDRAMLSASKWNSYFNRTRKDERTTCLDLQTLTVNVPLPATVPATTIVNRSIADEISKATSAEHIAEPPTLLKKREPMRSIDPASYYPVAVVPGQFGELYRHYSAQELLAFPLNTALGSLFGKNTAATTTTEDTDSANETLVNRDRSHKRSKILRSRRARTERSSKHTCDNVKPESASIEDKQQLNDKVKNGEDAQSDSKSISSTSSSSDSSSSFSSTSEATTSCYSSDDEADGKKYTCNVCQRVQNRNLKDLPELFVNCYTCRRRVHPSCIEMPHRMAQRVRNYNWQCAECKCCIKCKQRRDPNQMLYCEQCDRGFHIYCLGVKTVPDGRWSCERCSVCMRCGATKPEGLPQHQQQLFSPNGEKVKQIKHKKVKWINEYRIDHITKLREHCSMLCVPCGRNRTTMKRAQTPSHSSPTAQGNGNSNNRNACGSGSLSPASCSPTTQNTTPKSQMSPPAAPLSNSGHNAGVTASSNVAVAGATTTPTTANSTSTTPPPPPVVA